LARGRDPFLNYFETAAKRNKVSENYAQKVVKERFSEIMMSNIRTLWVKK